MAKEICSLEQFTSIIEQIKDQPDWRVRADRESDYCDGNQLDSDILQAQKDKGIPPAIENLIGKTINDIRGIEAKNRTDWKVIPESDTADDDVAVVFNQKLNKAERESGADRACSNAHKSQVKVGIGWVEVSREKDPFKFPYRCKAIHRNEMWWDMKSTEPDLSDAMWLMRRRWTDLHIAKMLFPKKKDLIEKAGTGWDSFSINDLANDSEGGGDTGLFASLDIERGWTVEESEWLDSERKRVCLFEVLTRHYKECLVLKLQEGRVVEYDPKDLLHRQAVALGFKLDKAMTSEIWKTFFLGPHKLHEEKLENSTMFNYVPFWGEKEDRTGVPYGIIRDLMYLQDEVNARVSKMQWGLSAVRTERTEGVVAMTDEVFRQTIGRPDADIILSPKAMANGGIFRVHRDFELNQQQFQRLQDIREIFKYIAGNSDAFTGQGGADSFIGLSAQIEQSMQSLATISDGFKFARQQVGSLLLSMIIADSQDEEEVLVSGGITKDDRLVTINQRTLDDETGYEYKTNDVSRTKLKVTLSEVPSTPSFRQQQLAALSEFGKSSAKEIQAVLAPHIANLADVPNKEEIVKAIRQAITAPTEEQIKQQIDDAVKAALAESGNALKTRELDIKERHTDAQIEKLVNEAVAKSVDAIYAAMQTAGAIVANPATAALADSVLMSAGMIDKDTSPIVPGFPEVAQDPTLPSQVQAGYNDQNMVAPANTNPTTPTPAPLPSNPGIGVRSGIETQAIEQL